MEQICYCDRPECRLREDQLTFEGVSENDWVTLAPARSQAPPRRLQRGGLAVDLVWGIRSKGMPLLGKPPAASVFEFDPAFRPESPAAQRYLSKVCRSMETEDVELLIFEKACWIEYFKEHLFQNGQLFPLKSSQFHALLAEFAQTGLTEFGGAVSDQLWFQEDGKMRAGLFVFRSDFPSNARAKATIEVKQKWDDAAYFISRDSVLDASTCWHTARAWILAEAEDALLNSTVVTMVVSLLCGFLGAAFYTQDMALSLMVVCSVTTLGAAFFLFFCGVSEVVYIH